MTSVLVVSNMYPPHHYGGYELSCRDVVDRWRARGHDVTVLTGTMRLKGVADPADERIGGVRRDLHIYYEDGELSSPPLRKRLAIERDNQRILQDTIDSVRPDVVSVWHMGAMSTGLLATLVDSGLPLVFVIADDWPTYAMKIDPWMRLWWQRPRVGRLVERVTGIPATLADIGSAGTFLFISGNTRDRCLKWSPWWFADSSITYNGIDLEDFPVADAPTSAEWRWRMVNAGRLDPRKGLETAVRSLVELPEAATLRLLAPVDDPYQARLEQLAAELGVSNRVIFVKATRAQLRDHYMDADVCVFPTEWDEPFGLVPIEAMACGTPVVATGSGGSGEFLVDEVNCLRIPPRQPAALAAAVRRLAEDEELRKQIVTGGFATALDLNVDRLADVLEQWHLAAAERFASGRPRHRVLATR